MLYLAYIVTTTTFYFRKGSQTFTINLIEHNCYQNIFWKNYFEITLFIEIVFNKKINAQEFYNSTFEFGSNYIDKYNKFI